MLQGESRIRSTACSCGRDEGPLEVLDDVALYRYIWTAGDARAVTAAGALMALGQELLKDRQYRDVEQLAVRHGAVHLTARGAGAIVVVGGAARIRTGELVVVYRRDVRRALDVLEAAGLLAQLRLDRDMPTFA